MSMNNNNNENNDKLTGEALMNHPLVQWVRDRLANVHGGNKSALCRELGTVSDKVVTALLDGTYRHDVNGMLARLREQKDRLAGVLVAREDVDLYHIPTKLSERVWVACDAAKAAHLIINVCGKIQIGKSTAVRMYKQRFPETTVLMRMPTKPTVASVLQELAEVLRVPRSAKSNAALQRALRGKLGPQHLLIVDEAHLALDRQQGADALDMVRELYDRCGCGVVLVFTDIGARKFCNGPFSGQLAQLDKRGEWEVLPGEPCAADVQAIWRGFGLPDPDSRVQAAIGAMCRAACFGTYVHRLKWAAAQARRQGVPLTWDLFVQATKYMSRRPDDER